MDDIERVGAWLESGRLTRPVCERPNFVDLVRSLARLAGAPAGRLTAGPGVDQLCAGIGKAEHYVLVLVDGMGFDLVEGLPKESFLRSHLAARLNTVFLSTTASALTALATAEWPARHGVPGWWTYLDEHDINAVVLPFTERLSGRPLGGRGVRADEVFPLPCFWPTLGHTPRSIMPRELVGSVYTNYSLGNTSAMGYKTIDEAVASASRVVASSPSPSFTYVYLPQLDSLAHAKGKEHSSVLDFLADIDRSIRRLARRIEGRARLLVTADHGLATVPNGRVIILPPADPLCQLLRCPPSGEATVPIFHVRADRQEAFIDAFRRRYGSFAALLTPDSVERLHLLGPDTLGPAMRRRLGSFVAIEKTTTKFLVCPYEGTHPHNPGVHGGLSRGEVQIPLILA